MPSERVLIVNPTRAWWSYVFTSEAALRLASRGSEVGWLDIPAVIGVQAELLHVNAADRWRRWAYRDPAKRIATLMVRHGIRPLSTVKPSCRYAIPVPSTRRELDEVAFQGVDIGSIVGASISGQLFQRYFDISEHQAIVGLQLELAARLTELIGDVMEKFDPSVVVTTNDRVLPAAVALGVARRDGRRTSVYYWGSDLDSVMSYPTSLYSQDDWREQAESAWQRAHADPQTLERAEARLRTIGSRPANSTFTSKMQGGLVPPRSKRRRMVIFPNTPWEYSATEGRERSQATDQLKMFSMLLEVLRDIDSDSWEVLVRHHPAHPDFGDRSEADAWDNLRDIYELQEFEATSAVDSYELAHSADLCVVWRSTIGVELLARGIPTVCLDETYWLPKNSPLIVRSRQDVVSFLQSPPQPPHPGVLLPYLNFQFGWGEPRKYAIGTGPEFRLAGDQVFRRRRLTWPLLWGRSFIRQVRRLRLTRHSPWKAP